MQRLIYYPTFEPPSDAWLKFSLLYFENLRPIIPYNRRHLVSQNFELVQHGTDLITICEPSYQDGDRASLLAIEEVERVLNRRYDRSPLYGQVNAIRSWSDRRNWDYLIFKEKFSYSWANFCEEHDLGFSTDDGLVTSEGLGFLFMTYLAKEIAFTESADIITDNNRFDNFTNYARATAPIVERKTQFAKGIFNLIVPRNLADIPIGRLIDFRNRNREKLAAFNIELDNIQTKITEGYSNRDFIEQYNDIYSSYSGDILLQGLGVASIPLAAYILLHDPHAKTPEYIKEILGSLGFLLGGIFTVNKALRDTQTKRYCKKYLTNLARLH